MIWTWIPLGVLLYRSETLGSISRGLADALEEALIESTMSDSDKRRRTSFGGRHAYSTYRPALHDGWDPYWKDSEIGVSYQFGKTATFGGTVLGLAVNVAEIPASLVMRALYGTSKLSRMGASNTETRTIIETYGGRPD